MSVFQKIFKVTYQFRRLQQRRKLTYPVAYSSQVEIGIDRDEIVNVK